jgi:hypothetical protein
MGGNAVWNELNPSAASASLLLDYRKIRPLPGTLRAIAFLKLHI